MTRRKYYVVADAADRGQRVVILLEIPIFASIASRLISTKRLIINSLQFGSSLVEAEPHGRLGKFIMRQLAGLLFGCFHCGSIAATAQQAPIATFKSGVDLVRVTAVVRDRKGRFVSDLTARDFEILDGGVRRPISDFRPDQSGVSVALLFDVSGSMEELMGKAREAAGHV